MPSVPQLLCPGPTEIQGRWVSAMYKLEVLPHAKVTEACMWKIQPRARPLESHSHSQPFYHCEMLSTGSAGLWLLLHTPSSCTLEELWGSLEAKNTLYMLN